jgi:Helicase associated domain
MYGPYPVVFVLVLSSFASISSGLVQPSVPKAPRRSQWTRSERLAQWKSFRAAYGPSALPSPRHDAKYPGLAAWIRHVRRQYQQQQQQQVMNFSTTTNMIDQLDETEDEKMLRELVLSTAASSSWSRRYQQLEAFHQQYGHCRVPNNDVQYPGLGIWVRNQRREYQRLLHEDDTCDTRNKAKKKSTLSPERLQALQRLDFCWYQSHSTVWQKQYQQLRDFCAEHGHSNVPQQSALGRWCMNQRTRRAVLSPERVRLLEELQFQWNVKDAVWDQMLRRFRDYYQQHGKIAIPVSDTDQNDLRLWLHLQRYYFHRQRLSPSRVQALDEVAAEWKQRRHARSGPSSEDWSLLFEEMRKRGIGPGVRPKQHWFEGVNVQKIPIKDTPYTEQELLELWNQEDDDEKDDVSFD